MNDIASDLAKVDGRIASLSLAIRRMPDRMINTRRHLDAIKARRELMSERDRLLRCLVTKGESTPCA